MSSNDLTLALRLYADTARWSQGLLQGERQVTTFGQKVKRELGALRQSFNTVQGQLATVGLSIGAVAIATQSARLDRTLIRIGLTAGASRSQVADLRQEIFSMAAATGQSVEDLTTGFNNLIQSGLDWRASLEVIKATNVAMAVTDANANALTSALTVTATAFDFDLSKPGLALELLDQMTVAGRLGNAELENLSAVVSRIGINAQRAGMDFQKMLGFVEGLSLIEKSPERLGTLADSTLRIFTNLNYRQQAQAMTGVRFFDKNGARRDAFEVIQDIKTRFDKLKTDQQREMFIGRAFGQADLDTIKGISTMLSGGNLDRMRVFADQISKGKGTLLDDVPTALNNSVDQVGRLKAKLRDAADSFAQPINSTISHLIAFALDKKEAGGLDMSGGNMIAGGLVLAGGAYAAKRYGGMLLGKLGGGAGNLATGVATGKALQAATGIQPVYVTNWPSSMGGVAEDVLGGLAGGAIAGKAGKAGKGLWGLLRGYFGSGWAATGGTASAVAGQMGIRALGGVGLAAGTGWAIGSGINALWGDKIADALDRITGLAARNEALLKPNNDVSGTIRIEFDPATGAPVIRTLKSENRNVDFDIHNGPMMVTP